MSNDFHITVGAGLRSGVPIQSQINHEMRMVKSALLYGERVTLVSTISACLAPTLNITAFSPIDRAKLVEKWLLSLNSSIQVPESIAINLQLYHELLQKKENGWLTSQEEANLRELDKIILSVLEIAQTNLNASDRNSGIGSYKAAVDTGAVVLATSGLGSVDRTAAMLSYMTGRPADEIVKGDPDLSLGVAADFVYSLSQANADGKYLLFDQYVREGVGKLAFNDEDEVSGAQLKRAKHLSLATDVLQRIPNLENATFDEIMDIRKEYQIPLKRFRAALIRFSEEIQSAPWDSDFSYEVEDLFRVQVEPEIANIEEQMKSNKFITTLMRKVSGSDFNVPTGSALGIALSSMCFLPDLVSKVLGTAVAAALLSSSAYKEWKEEQKEIEKNQLYFYYQAGHILTK